MRTAVLLACAVCVVTLASPVHAQTPAANNGRIEAVVLDAQGLPILGAQVTATLRDANLSRTVASSSERFSLDGLTPGVYTVRISAPGFQVQDVKVDLTLQTTQSIEVRLNVGGLTEQLVVTPARSEQRVADVPASVSLVTNEQIAAVAGRRGRRRAAAGADVQPVPPHQQPRGEPDGAGRVAARHRPERRQPHARAARRHPVQRSVRRLGVLDPRADDERRSHRGHRRRRPRASTATTRWAASSTS